MWDLISAVDLARKFENLVVPFGYHVALGGSVLYRGTAEKDLDIFLYLHTRKKNEQPVIIDSSDFIVNVLCHQFPTLSTARETHDIEHGKSASDEKYKVIRRLYLGDKRIDLIFLLPHEICQPQSKI